MLILIVVMTAIDFPGGKRNRNKKIRAQLRILKCIAISLTCLFHYGDTLKNSELGSDLFITISYDSNNN